MSQTTPHTYEIFVNSTPEQAWKAITDPELTQKYYYGGKIETSWEVGSKYRYVGPSGDADIEGKILEVEPQQRLVTTFEPKWFPVTDQEPSKLTWEVVPVQGISLIKLTHENIDDESFSQGQLHTGWVYILSGLKTTVETGNGLPSIFG